MHLFTRGRFILDYFPILSPHHTNPPSGNLESKETSTSEKSIHLAML